MRKITKDEYRELALATVVKSNELVTKTTFSLSAVQQKIVLFLISKILPSDDRFIEQTFTITEFCRACGIDNIGSKTYDIVWDALDKLEAAEIKYRGDNKIPLEDGSRTKLKWILKHKDNPSKGTVTVMLDPDLMPFLLHLISHFLSYELLWALSFRSRFSIRLYEYAKARHYNTLQPYTFEITPDALKDRMGADAPTYRHFKNFRQRALEPAVKEINAKSDIIITYEQITERNRTKALKMTVESKPMMESLELRAKLESAYAVNQLSFFDPPAPPAGDPQP